MTELEQKIVDSAKDGTFLKLIYDEYCESINKDYEVSKTLIELHNRKIIDVISEFESLSNTSANFNFFQIRHILEDVIPSINYSVKKVKNCVRNLTIKAGQDMASHALILPFIKFCSADISRVDALLEQELEVIDDDFDHISTALISGYNIDKKVYFDRAIGLLKHEDTLVIQRTIFALSRFDYTEDPKLASVATKEIITCTRTTKDEQILSTAINTLITLLSDFEELEPSVIDFIEHNIDNNSSDFIFRIAQQLNYRHVNLSDNIQRLLFSFFKNIDSEWKGVINQIDLYIYNKMSGFDALTIAQLFEYILSNNVYSLNIGTLNNSLRRLQEKEYEEMLSTIFTRWLLKREFVYCLFAVKIVKTTTTDQIEIGFDRKQIKAEDLTYLANKAVGWFNLQPLTALSLIMSILPMLSDSEMKLIEKNTFNYIALNYLSQTKKFLEEHLNSSDKNTMNFSKNITQQLENFLEDFNNLQDAKELKPSIRQRNEYVNYQQKLFDEASSEPKEELFFSSLFTKKITLYGNKFIHKHKDSNGATVRQVMPFSKMSHSIDFPSLVNLTPHTQEYFLRLLKVEELANETNP